MHSHLQDFAHELIARHGPRTSGMIWQAFTNVGNIVPGASVSDQIASVEKALKGDDRLSFEDATEGREGGLFSHRDNHNDN